jgi:hypothetical protein
MPEEIALAIQSRRGSGMESESICSQPDGGLYDLRKR